MTEGEVYWLTDNTSHGFFIGEIFARTDIEPA
jgi:hypothetical protein